MGIDTLISQLKEYLTESVENKRVMEESYNKKDDINYEIVVHKLKSESRMLGLTDLGEMFYNHELAAKRKDWDYINKEYTSLISEYDKVLNVLEKLVSNFSLVFSFSTGLISSLAELVLFSSVTLSFNSFFRNDSSS